MSISVPIYVGNPEDGVATFDKIVIFRSDDDFAAVAAEIDITVDTRSHFDSGYTEYADPEGDEDYTYKVQYKNSSTGLVSPLSEAYAYKESSIIKDARRQLKDTDSSNYVFSTDELADMEDRGVRNLFPGILKPAVDTSNTIEANKIDYDLPIGAFRITSLHRGSVVADTWKELDDFDLVRGRILRLPESEVSDGGDTLTIEYTKKYRNSGELPSVVSDIVLYDVLAECYEMLANERGVKFKAYAAQKRDSDVRPETLQGLANKYRELAVQRRQEIERG